MSHVICPLSLVPVRAEASDRAELVTQWLFGETAEVVERTEKWWKLRFDHDGYEGWVDAKQIDPCTSPNYDPDLRVIEAGTIVDLGDRPVSLPVGAVLPFHEYGHILWDDRRIAVKALTNSGRPTDRTEQIELFTHPFIGAPYLWGGRTPWGVDCSGLTQAVFMFMGIYLPRDASEQALEGDPVEFTELARTGDLAFFDNAEGRITHVGIVLQAEEGVAGARIIHASGRVRVDALDQEGINNAELGRYTHKLRMIKRIS